jgi:UBX domain-containing protein 1
MCREEWGNDADAVRVQLIDKSSETYKAKFSFAASKGQSLGTSSSSSSSQTASLSSIPASRITLDSSQPTTVLQLVLADRRRLRETVNVSNTVAQVYGHIAAVSSSAPGTFEIVAGFPPKPLTQLDQTLKDAGLTGSSIQQKMLQ